MALGKLRGALPSPAGFLAMRLAARRDASAVLTRAAGQFRRLRRHGLIERVRATHSYALTSESIRVAVFYSKARGRLLGPLLEANQPSACPELHRALGTIEHVLGEYVTNARLGLAG